MKLISILCCVPAVLALGACTTQEKALVKDLENMPGVTCVSNDGQTHCGPDSLKATQTTP